MAQWSARLIVAVVTTIAQEVAIVLIVVFALPPVGVRLAPGWLILILVVWGSMMFSLYRAGSSALAKKPMTGFTRMADTTGMVVRALEPRGAVMIRGELWDAVSFDGKRINEGEEVLVLSQQGLKLTVKRAKRGESAGPD